MCVCVHIFVSFCALVYHIILFLSILKFAVVSVFFVYVFIRVYEVYGKNGDFVAISVYIKLSK